MADSKNGKNDHVVIHTELDTNVYAATYHHEDGTVTPGIVAADENTTKKNPEWELCEAVEIPGKVVLHRAQTSSGKSRSRCQNANWDRGYDQMDAWRKKPKEEDVLN